MPPILHLIAKAIQDFPTDTAIVDGERRLNRQELLVYGTAMARAFREAGAEAGDHIGVMLPNNAAWIAAWIATQLNGQVLVGINPLSPPAELAQLRKTGGFNYILTGGPLIQLAASLGDVKIIDAAEVKPGPEDMAKAGETLQAAVARTKPDDPAIIIFTSGTTGASKAALLSQENLGSNTIAAQKLLQLTGPASAHLVIPLFHSFGILLTNLCLIIGGKIGLQARFNPSSALELVEEEKLNIMVLVPPMIALAARQLTKKKYDLSSTKLLVSGGSALPPTIFGAWNQVAPDIELIQGYGQTEAAPMITAMQPNGNHFPTVGPPVDGVEVMIWGEQDECLPDGEIGEVVARGPNIMLGYYNDEDATRSTVTPQGWLRTGDFGMLQDGILTITGRKKELIIVSGENVYPQEVEHVIEAVPGVMEVAVVAGFDDLRGEFVRACIAPMPEDPENPGELPSQTKLGEMRDSVLAACRENLASQKVPRTVEFMPALPRNALGKILKRELEVRGPQD